MRIAASPSSPAPQPPEPRKSRIDVGIEIGTSKICVAVGERASDGTLSLLGVGQAPSRGVRMGIIVDFAIVGECVREALADAEEQSDVTIKSVRLAVTGYHISSFNHRSEINPSDFPRIITERDCQLAQEKAREAAIAEQNAVLHFIPQHYRIDGQEGVLNPVGLCGNRLEAGGHLRMRETLELLKRKLAMEQFAEALGAGVFLTDGTSLLPGIDSLAQEIFEMPVHLTHEQGNAGADNAFRNPMFSTVLGLLGST